VGKSSLLNWLFQQRVALVAKAPGKTRRLNFYLVNRSVFLVDLPGYGFAKVSRTLREDWGRELGRYLLTEERLAAVITLVDIRHGLTRLDHELQDMLVAAGRERILVLTKADKVGRGHQRQMQDRVQRELGLALPPIAVSVRSAEGRQELLGRIDDAITLWRQQGDRNGTQEEDQPGRAGGDPSRPR
jgi:GTP-binding protein